MSGDRSGVIDRSVPKEWISERARQFAKAFKKDKEWWEQYFFTDKLSSVNHLIGELKLNKKKMQAMKKVVDFLLTDIYYHILRGLDGSESIGATQTMYKIYDEDNNLISDCGDLEAAAYEVFYGQEDD